MAADLTAGLPFYLAVGLLVFDPIDPGFIVVGATAGLFGAIVAGAVVALAATSSFVADKDSACYELSSDDFDILLRNGPKIAARIMRNMARELARRLRRTSEDLRNAASRAAGVDRGV